MKNVVLFLISTVISGLYATTAQADTQDSILTGTVIGTLQSVDYGSNTPSTKVNTRECAFDGDLNTYVAAYDRSFAWVGLDLGEPFVITRIGWAPANRNRGDERILLGVFEGSNSPDFMDALPLYIIPEKGTYKKMTYTDVTCSKGFRYVRYVGPSDQRCNIAELEFYGHAGEGDESNLYRLTNLPTVSIHTEDNVEPYDNVHNINALITIISDNKLRTDSGTVRYRGNGSLNFPKKPYRIKYNKKHKVLDSPAKAKKWTLINNYGDKTLMRNLLANELSRCLEMPYTPYSQSVDVLLNGEYKGNYQLCDHIDVKKNRVELVDTLNENQDESLSTAFLVEVDARASTEPSWFMSKNGTPITIHYPEDDEITPEQATYIEESFNRMEDDWQTYLDLNTFLRHFLVGELSGNTDTYWSVYMYKHRENDTIYVGPVWDFDLAFENDKRTYPINDKKNYIYRSGGSVCGNMQVFVDNIVMRNTDAKAKMLEIWGNARVSGINEYHLLDFVDRLEEELQESQKLNFIRWPIMNEEVQQNPVVWGSYEAEVQNVRRFISERLLWMDQKIGYTFNPTGITDASLESTQSYQIFNVSGQLCSGNLQHLPKGIYVVKQGRIIRKVQVK
ncbi:MAG: CotH kinase family protein [Bacteroidaceae bacterium]|nr:CotH kinase family protein [Bacteroidaceae bacterium]